MRFWILCVWLLCSCTTVNKPTLNLPEPAPPAPAPRQFKDAQHQELWALYEKTSVELDKLPTPRARVHHLTHVLQPIAKSLGDRFRAQYADVHSAFENELMDAARGQVVLRSSLGQAFPVAVKICTRLEDPPRTRARRRRPGRTCQSVHPSYGFIAFTADDTLQSLEYLITRRPLRFKPAEPLVFATTEKGWVPHVVSAGLVDGQQYAPKHWASVRGSQFIIRPGQEWAADRLYAVFKDGPLYFKYLWVVRAASEQ